MLLFALLRPSIDRAVDPLWQIILIVAGLSVGRIFAPTMLIKFFLYFPVRQNVPKRKLILSAFFIINLIATCCLIFLGTKLSTTLALVLAFLPILYFIIGLSIFAVSYFTQVDVGRRNQLKPILHSVAIGIVTFIYIGILITVNPFAIFLNPLLVVPAVLTIGVPMAFGYAIFRHRLMDIDLIIKRSLVYGSVTAAIAAIYLVMVYGVGNLFTYFMGTEDNRIANLVAFILIALLFDPLKRRTQASIDHLFYQERLNYQKALLEFSQELPSQINLDQILSSMVNRISTTMHVEKVAVVLCDEQQGCDCKSRNIDEQWCRFTAEEGGLLALLKETRTAQSFALLEEEPDSVMINAADKEKIVSSGIVLTVPIILQERVIGMINVGPKLSGKVYSQEDIDLLSTVAGQAAIAIENARLHISEVEKQKIEGELKLAWKIQQGLLPKGNPSIEGLDITGITLPARTVGGDYFDYIQLGPKKILVVVADVSGKGISAALYMSKVQGMVQLAAQMYSSPKDILVHVNRRLYDGMERNSFITMIIALFDLDKRELKICRAGHNKAIIGMNGDLSYLQAKGIGLGLERGKIFEQELEEVTRPLQSNELLMFYTDGLTEAMDARKNQFGEEAVCELLKNHSRQSASGLQQSLISAVKNFQGTAEQHDDVTLVVVKVM
jgi:sigma-B regulation protein RsbU (phosphoserine phosphatase)